MNTSKFHINQQNNSPLWLVTTLFMVINWVTAIKSYAQEIDCDNTVYITTHNPTGSSLYRFQVDAEKGINNLEEIFVDNKDYRFGCLGYSVVDKMIYALEFNTYELLRINALGEITNLGIPTGIDTTLFYYSGDIFPSGRDFLVIGSEDNTKLDKLFFAIDVFELRATPLSVISDGKVAIQDMTRDPIIGNLYGFDNNQRKLVEVNNGQISSFQFPSISERFTSIFFDKSGQLYGLGSTGGASSRKFFTIDKLRGEAEYLQEGPMGSDSDACGCPYTFQFYRKVSPQQVSPCGEVTIEYTFFNTSGSARTNLRIFDELPKELSITDIAFTSQSNMFNAKINGDIGANILDITRIEVLLGNKNTISVKATVSPDAAGILSSQAILKNLPLALNPDLKSDNIETTIPEDPNLIEIISFENAVFEDLITFSCDNRNATLTAPIPNAISFLWSNNSTKASTVVDTSGIYWVEMVTACETIRYDIEVNFDEDLPFVDLGIDRIQNTGESFSLIYTTNLEQLNSITWSSTEVEALSCLDCPNPSVQLITPATISVRLTNSQGCTAEDEIKIDINDAKQVYAPTAFSPNGDGINDFFYLQGTIGSIEVFGIFDRWGNQVFENKNGSINDLGHAWKGLYHNKRLESGVFIWYANIIHPDGKQELITGTVTLLK